MIGDQIKDGKNKGDVRIGIAAGTRTRVACRSARPGAAVDTPALEPLRGLAFYGQCSS